MTKLRVISLVTLQNCFISFSKMSRGIILSLLRDNSIEIAKQNVFIALL